MKVGDTVHSEFWYFSGRITSQEIKSKYHTLKKQNKKQTHKKKPPKNKLWIFIEDGLVHYLSYESI